MPKYYDDLTLEEMFEQFDHTYMMSVLYFTYFILFI